MELRRNEGQMLRRRALNAGGERQNAVERDLARAVRLVILNVCFRHTAAEEGSEFHILTWSG